MNQPYQNQAGVATRTASLCLANRQGQVSHILIPILAAIAALLFLAPTLLTPIAKRSLKHWLSSQLPGELQIGEVSLSWFELKVSNIQYRDNPMRLEFRSQELRWQLSGWGLFRGQGSPLIQAKLELKEPTLTYTIDSSGANTKQTAKEKSKQTLENFQSTIPSWLKPWILGSASDSKNIIKFSSHIETDHGEVTLHFLNPGDKFEPVKTVRWTDITLQIQSNPVDDLIAMNANSKTNVNGWGLRLQLPLELSGEIQHKNTEWVGQNSKLNLAGLELIGRGTSNFQSGAHHWTFDSTVPNLAQVKVLPTFLPPGQWQGGLSSKLTFIKQGGRSWRASGQVSATDLFGNIDWISQEITAKGHVKGKAYADFYFENILLFRDSNIELDLSGMKINYKDVFSKPAGVPFNILARGDRQSSSFRLKEFRLNFANFLGRASGLVNYKRGDSSQVNIDIPQTSLVGWEKYFPFMRGYPTSGSLQVKGQLTGDWQDLSHASISLSPISLKEFRAKFDWNDPKRDIFISGPLAMNIQGDLVTGGLQVVKGEIQSTIDLSPMQLRWQDVIDKPNTSQLALRLNINQAEHLLKVERAQILTDSGIVKLLGELRDLTQFDISASTTSLNLGKVSHWFKPIQSLSAIENLSGDFKVSGHFDWNQNSWVQPPLLSGHFNARSGALTLPSPIEVSGAEYAMLTNTATSRLLFNSTLDGDFKVKELNVGQWLLRNVHLRGRWRDQHFDGNVSANDFFLGKIQSPKLQINTQPISIKAEVEYENIALDRLLSSLAPNFSPPFAGLASGRFYIESPWSTQIIPNLLLKGSLTSNSALVNIPFDNQLRRAETELGLSFSHIMPLNRDGHLIFRFEYQNALMTLNDIHFSAGLRDLWQGQGTLGTEVNLKGQIDVSKTNSKSKSYANWQWAGPIDSPNLFIDFAQLQKYPTQPANRNPTISQNPTSHVDKASSDATKVPDKPNTNADQVTNFQNASPLRPSPPPSHHFRSTQ